MVVLLVVAQRVYLVFKGVLKWLLTFQNEVLSGLARPDFGRGMFQVGQALGGIGGQYRAKKADDEFNALMAQASEAQKNNNDVALFNIAQQLRDMGRNQAVSAVSATATKIKDTKITASLLVPWT